jgi:hypothetical protein
MRSSDLLRLHQSDADAIVLSGHISGQLVNAPAGMVLCSPRFCEFMAEQGGANGLTMDSRMVDINGFFLWFW